MEVVTREVHGCGKEKVPEGRNEKTPWWWQREKTMELGMRKDH